ncbi:MAG TPA: hypothetical protein VNA19_12570 [Pyrinomonadaceae bacterium]|jgi:hypothetical protein|nr:hypothetical protein [Pyrinomonadaceae bacterium]
MNNKRVRASINFSMRWLAALAILLPATLNFSALAAQKMKPEDVVAKHLAAIGADADRAAVKNIVIAGTSLLTLTSPGKGQNSGEVVLFSEGQMNMVGIKFYNPDYPHDKFGFDGTKMTVSYIKPGIRSTLGDFIYNRDFFLKQGLFGGTLSTSWPLLNMASREAKMEYGGTSKIKDRLVHELKYSPRKGADMRISMFFDAETFHHVRTEYKQTVSGQLGGTTNRASSGAEGDKSGQRDLHYRLVEDFSDFKKEGKLTLPHTYKIGLSLERQNGNSYIAEWELKLVRFSFNQQLEPSFFDAIAAN